MPIIESVFSPCCARVAYSSSSNGVCALRAAEMQSAIPAALIGNWEIAGIRPPDVSRPDSITVIGHLETGSSEGHFRARGLSSRRRKTVATVVVVVVVDVV